MRPMEQTLKGTVRYDGTGFAGWQRQEDQRTVQGELEAALSRIAGRPTPIQGAGRTDAGVHAFGQVFSCRWPAPPPDRLRHALSQMLSPEIRVTELITAAESFNARFDAVGKSYAYTIDVSKEADPFSAHYAWHVPYKLDLNFLASLLPQLEGEHDFAGFESTGSQMKTTVRCLHRVTLQRGGLIAPADANELWHLRFHGNGFLYHMVRNLAGTLIEIARGRFEPTFLAESLTSGGPFKGHCAPAHGLVLEKVFYEDG